jgi:protoheme IX farnesyltransferase
MQTKPLTTAQEAPAPEIEAVKPARADPRDWLLLLKPRVISLVVFTGAIGLFIAPGHIGVLPAAIAIFCIALGAGAAGAINMWYDRDIDALMKRTLSRPIPAGRVNPEAALDYGVVLSIVSVVLLGMATNLCAAITLAVSIFYYAVIYTMWLKRRTPQNIVIGGGAGAFPAIIGWAAVMGHIGLLPVLLFAIVFFWTPPHFWSLSLYAAKDYAKAGIPMLPVVKGAKHTRLNVLVYAVVLLLVAVSPWPLHLLGPVYGLSALVMSTAFLYFCWGVYTDAQDAQGQSLTGDKPARAAFKFSLLYLFIIFAAVAVDRLV